MGLLALLCACSSNDEEEQTILNPDEANVTLRFTSFEQTPMTRSSLTEASMSHLDVWLSDGTTTQEFHQSSTDSDFGTIATTLNKKKTYTLYAVAHKASDALTLSDGVLSYPDDKVKETFYYSTSFSPATTTSIDAIMNRIVGKLTLQTTDAVPDDVAKMRFTMTAATRLNLDGTPANNVSRTVEFASISRNQTDGTCSFSFYLLAASTNTDYAITATAYDADNDVVETKTFTDIPIRNNYKTTLSGDFFVSTSVGINLSTVDWLDEEIIDF